MTYTPKSEETLAKEGLLAAGTYDFEVGETRDNPSKAGNPMFTLILRVFEADGSSKSIYDYIALGNNFGERKLRHAADACGLLDVYEAGNLKAGDFQGKSGKVEIKIQDGNAEYPLPKNAVVDYVKREEASYAGTTKSSKANEGNKDTLDDEIPF